MFLNALLEASAKTTNIVKWVSVGAIVVLFGVIAVICIKGKKRYDAKHIAFAGISLSLSFVLSLIKVSPVTYGGSITLASFVPLLIYTYVYGLADGLLTGLIFGLFNFVTGPYILTPLTFILDYLLAFASIGLMGIAGKFTKKTTFNVVLGTVAVYVVRFVFHLFSGMIYFSMDRYGSNSRTGRYPTADSSIPLSISAYISPPTAPSPPSPCTSSQKQMYWTSSARL